MQSEHPQRTYLRRRGRMTHGQARALSELSSHFCLDLPEPGTQVQWPAVFGRDAPVGLEIGFGMGQALIDWARSARDWNLVGIEVYQPGIGALLHQAQSEGFDHIRILEGDANDLLLRGFAAQSLSEARIFFPDPWPKKRHAKRRLLQPGFVRALAERLGAGGLLWVATDWAEYATWAETVLTAEPLLQRVLNASPVRIETRFEQRGRRLGHDIYELQYRRP